MGRAKAQTELMHDTTGPLDVASSNFDSEKACRSMRHYSPRHFHFVYVIDIYIMTTILDIYLVTSVCLVTSSVLKVLVV